MDRRKFTTLGAASAIALLGPRQLRAQGTQPLKIGIMNDLSSVYADFQGFRSKIAAELAVADYAAKAGVAARTHGPGAHQEAEARPGPGHHGADGHGARVIAEL